MKACKDDSHVKCAADERSLKICDSICEDMRGNGPRKVWTDLLNELLKAKDDARGMTVKVSYVINLTYLTQGCVNEIESHMPLIHTWK